MLGQIIESCDVALTFMSVLHWSDRHGKHKLTHIYRNSVSSGYASYRVVDRTENYEYIVGSHGGHYESSGFLRSVTRRDVDVSEDRIENEMDAMCSSETSGSV